ncbi:MAG: Rieske 2Fe-2S domain-containing protein [Hyphomonadaceae bacterium]
MDKSEPTATAQEQRIYSGYYQKASKGPDLFLTQVGRGTPGGEYLRRFWMPIAYLSELTDVPLRARALGEDLVVFKDGANRVGALALHCCHRNASLEFGVVEQRGIRCCYHGRLIDIDGTILEMPGEPESVQKNTRVRQGAYPTHVFGGVVFIYMGPPERIPVFPMYDRLKVLGVEIAPGSRWPVPCNWLQVQENTMDPAHTATLHAIPQLRGMDHFSRDFGNFPDAIWWTESPEGMAYFAARRVGENVWVRSGCTMGAISRGITSAFEGGEERKRANYPFFTAWILPIDDHASCNFYVSHLTDREIMPFEKRRLLEDFGQTDERPYRDRQIIPGDYEAESSQGAINDHSLEHLATMDRGVVMFRRYLRRNITAVEQGKDPHGFYLNAADVPPTFANDRVVDAAAVPGDPNDQADLLAYCEQLFEDYRRTPPMSIFDR